jgi:hypothetical protein
VIHPKVLTRHGGHRHHEIALRVTTKRDHLTWIGLQRERVASPRNHNPQASVHRHAGQDIEVLGGSG